MQERASPLKRDDRSRGPPDAGRRPAPAPLSVTCRLMVTAQRLVCIQTKTYLTFLRFARIRSCRRLSTGPDCALVAACANKSLTLHSVQSHVPSRVRSGSYVFSDAQKSIPRNNSDNVSYEDERYFKNPHKMLVVTLLTRSQSSRFCKVRDDGIESDNLTEEDGCSVCSETRRERNGLKKKWSAIRNIHEIVQEEKVLQIGMGIGVHEHGRRRASAGRGRRPRADLRRRGGGSSSARAGTEIEVKSGARIRTEKGPRSWSCSKARSADSKGERRHPMSTGEEPRPKFSMPLPPLPRSRQAAIAVPLVFIQDWLNPFQFFRTHSHIQLRL
ncbi:hypothetical protein EVAR_55067_1 [Eumeta japonica]|uniref:Uncharacterized protein n=1 Tax=Eumeta variegata TaxID=151549 RepID=A0A4C1Z5D7_EUMVA|nr:hypothetical protein EVAR_55067_1 [Eumeta japonica]